MQPLIDASELLARLDDPILRIADVRWYLGQAERGRAEYAAGHVPGAVFVDLDRDLAAATGAGRHPLPEPGALAARLGALGLGSAHEIVAYDDVSGAVAGRLWWMLAALGHPRTRLLDGGLRAWRAIGGPTTPERPTFPPAELSLAPSWQGIVERDALRGRIGSVTLLDLRAGERYRGETEPVDPVAGHIPTAVSLPAMTLVGDDGRLLPPDALRARFADVGAADGPAVVSCGSGVTACLAIVAARVAGLPEPLLYPGSWSDWSRSGLPVATGATPGAPP